MLRAEIFYSSEDILPIDFKNPREELLEQLKYNAEYVQLHGALSDTVFTIPLDRYPIAWTEFDESEIIDEQKN